MITGIGYDIVEVERIRKIHNKYKNVFAKRILSDAELGEYRKSSTPARFLAKRFAAKEAVVKALGTGFSNGIGPGMIGIDHDESGKPVIVLYKEAKQRADQLGANISWISISDEKSYAAAFVVMEKQVQLP